MKKCAPMESHPIFFSFNHYGTYPLLSIIVKMSYSPYTSFALGIYVLFQDIIREYEKVAQKEIISYKCFSFVLCIIVIICNLFIMYGYLFIRVDFLLRFDCWRKRSRRLHSRNWVLGFDIGRICETALEY